MSQQQIPNTQLIDSVINNGYRLALINQHQVVGVNHILAALVNQPLILNLLQKVGANLKDVALYINDSFAKEQKTLSQPLVSKKVNYIKEMAIQNGLRENRTNLEIYDLLIGILADSSIEATQVLLQLGVTLDKVQQEITNNSLTYSLFQNENANSINSNSQQDPSITQQTKVRTKNPLEDFPYLLDLNKKFRDNSLELIFGRDEEIEKVIHTLSKKKKNNAILVGEAGTGKTAIAEGLAQRIVQKSVPEEIQGYTVYSLDLGGLVSGTKFRGDFEEKLTKCINFIKSKKAILFIDEIHMLLSAGGAGEGSMNAANLLKPLLASGQVRCLGATTYKEYRNTIEKDNALSRRFQKVDVKEPSKEATVKILEGIKSSFENFHKVTYTEESLKLAVDLSVKYITDKFLPDKAIDVIDEAGTYVKFNKDLTEKVVDADAIQKVISKIARIPEQKVTETQSERMKLLEKRLKEVIFGQNKAIDSLVNTILVSKSGLGNSEKPVGSFIFGGPTGVGKTELARQLSNQLDCNMTRIDMSEYKESHTVSKLIGAPPGYVGFEQEGILTSSVIKNPFSVILLDEIEKAHPQVLDLLLQILDYGKLTDGAGKVADFKNAIIICTTNVGTEELSRNIISLKKEEEIQKDRDPKGLLMNSFRPEFLNRFDDIIWFNSLTKENVIDLVDKNLEEVQVLLAPKGITLSFTKDLKSYLAEKGYDQKFGARPMARLIQNEIKIPLSKKILFESLSNGSTIKISYKNKEIKFEVK